MSRILEAVNRLTRRTVNGLLQVVCPRCNTGTMTVDRSDDVEDALVCFACRRVYASERRSEGERRIMEEVGVAQAHAAMEVELDRILRSGPTIVKKEMCERLGITRSRLDRRLVKEPITGGRKVREQPNRWHFPEGEAEAWIEDHKDSFPPVPGRGDVAERSAAFVGEIANSVIKELAAVSASPHDSGC